MKRLVVAIDCDDVLVLGMEHTIMIYNRIWGTEVPLAQTHNPLAVEWDAEAQEIHNRIDDIYLSEEYAVMKPYSEAIEVMNRLGQKYELHMVTSRPETLLTLTERMVSSYFPDCFSSVRHVSFYGSKGDICEAVRADVLIDDNLKHLSSAKACGVISLIWFGVYPWQEGRADSEAYTARCLDWPSVEEEIAKLAAE